MGKKKKARERKGKKPKSKSKHKNIKNYEKYKSKDTIKWCPRCGPGTHLAKHKNRSACGKCGYAEMQKKPENK